MNIKDFFALAKEQGYPIPFAYDAATKQASVTVLFMWIANILAIISLIHLHIKSDAIIATASTILYASLQTIFYMIRKINKANVNLKNQSIDIEGGDDVKKDS